MLTKLNKDKILEMNDENKIYEFLFDKVYELGKIIIDTKGIKHEETVFKDDMDLKLYGIQQDIYYESIWFESYRVVSDWVMYRYEEDVLEEKVTNIVKVYNELIDELEEYNGLKQKIEKEGLEKLEGEVLKNLREIFCKMLDYKNRKYNKDGSLSDLIGELVLCYSDYKWIFDETYTMLKRFIYKDTMRDDFWMVKADDVEYISSLEFAYKYFAENEDNYKNYKQYYEDITLKEGQTLKDLYNEEREKLKLLFAEMLDFINIEIEDRNNYYTLEALVREYYPYYSQNLISIEGAHTYSYIDLIHTIKTNYDYFKRTYQNHKEDLIHYIQKEKEELEEAKQNEGLLYDPSWTDDLNKLKERFSDYFKDE